MRAAHSLQPAALVAAFIAGRDVYQEGQTLPLQSPAWTSRSTAFATSPAQRDPARFLELL